MKSRKFLALALTILLLAAMFAGCSSKDYAGENMEVAPVVPGDGGIYDSGADVEKPAVTDRKLIRRITMNAETENLDTMLSDIDARVAQLGGYVESREVRGGSTYSEYSGSRSAHLVIRIPAEKLDELTQHVESVGNVTYTSETTEDVTLSYVAIESRMKALQAEEERLLALIDEAANLTELLELEERLTEVRTELEKVISQLRVYDNLVDYGTVELYLDEVQTLTPKEEPGFWQRISTGFGNSMKNLGIILRELVIFFVVCIPYLIPVAVVTVVVLVIVKLTSRKKKAPKHQNPNQT